jgi:hypothetical protein
MTRRPQDGTPTPTCHTPPMPPHEPLTMDDWAGRQTETTKTTKTNDIDIQPREPLLVGWIIGAIISVFHQRDTTTTLEQRQRGDGNAIWGTNTNRDKQRQWGEAQTMPIGHA